MKKKFISRIGAVAMAAVMTAGVALSHFAPTKVNASEIVNPNTFSPVTIGATDYSTAFWGAHSDSWNVEKGQSLVVTFTNYNKYETDSASYNIWNNYVVAFTTVPFGTAEGYTEYMVSTAAHNSWGTKVPEGNPNQRSFIDWNTQGADFCGATIKLVVSRDENNVVNYTAYARNTVNGAEVRRYNGNTFTITDDDDCYVHLSVDNSYLTITNIEYYEGVLVGAPDMSSGLDFCHTPSIAVADGDEVVYKLENYIGGANWDSVRTFLSAGDHDYNNKYATVRLDNYLDGGSLITDGWNSNVGGFACNYDWDNFKTAYSGADTTIRVSRIKDIVTWKVEIKDGNGECIGSNEISFKLATEDASCYVWLSTTYSYFVLESVDMVNHMTSIEAAESEIKLDKGTNTTLSVNVKPDDAVDEPTYKYNSSNEAVATVDENGKVTAVAVGETTITITATAGTNVRTTTVKVTVYASAKEVTVDESISILTGNSKNLTVKVLPEDTTDKWAVTYASSNEDIATVDENGKVTAVAAGEATVTATLVVGGKTIDTAECAVSVTNDEVPLTGMEAAADNTGLKAGETATISVTCTPKDTTDDTTATYTSSDDKVVTVDATGKVTAVAAGTATVTVKVGKFTKEIEFTVYAENTEVKTEEDGSVTATSDEVVINVPADVTGKDADGKEVAIDENTAINFVKDLVEDDDTTAATKEEIIKLVADDEKEVKKVAVFDLSLFVNDVKISTLSEGIKVTLAIPEDIDATKEIVVYVQEADGTWKKLDSEVVDGKVTFTAPHFSLYSIVQLDAAEKVPSPEMGDAANFAVILLAIACVAGVFFAVKRRKVTE